jgi:hypothetical protein
LKNNMGAVTFSVYSCETYTPIFARAGPAKAGSGNPKQNLGDNYEA